MTEASLPPLAQALLQRARKLPPSPWDRQLAGSLCDDCHDLADRALEEDRDDLGEALLGYATYLSSFVEGALVPNADQLAQLQALTESLDEALQRLQARTTVTDLAAAPAVLVPAGTLVWAVGLAPTLSARLAAQLEARGQRLATVATAMELQTALTEGRVLALAIARNQLSAWQQLLARLTSLQISFERPALLCVGEDSRMGYRLQALRAGAEGYYTAGSDDLGLARRLVDLVEDHTRPFRVLVVDDDATITMFCEAVLRHNGMQARTLNQPLQLFEVLEDFQPDVVLVDLYMPDVNGLELLALLRSHPDTLFTPVILLSGDDDVERRFDALHLGGDDYLTKPIRPRFLVAAVSSRARRARWVRRELQAREPTAAAEAALAEA